MADTTLMNEEDMLSEEDLEQLAPVYRTYGMDHEHGRIRGMIDGEEACRHCFADKHQTPAGVHSPGGKVGA